MNCRRTKVETGKIVGLWVAPVLPTSGIELWPVVLQAAVDRDRARKPEVGRGSLWEGNHMGFGDETDTEYEEREETKNDSRFLFEII